MHIRAAVLWQPKQGNRLAEYEDAFYPFQLGEFSAPSLRFAVADGASEGMLSGQWARLLTRDFCRHDPATMQGGFSAWLQARHTAWNHFFKKYLQEREKNNRPVQWYEEEGLQKGAFSTLLGLRFQERGAWSALGVGDTCLFQIREGALLTAFPLASHDAFNNRPILLASNPRYNADIGSHVKGVRGTWLPDDEFLLLTDALAAWFLHPDTVAPWQMLAELDTDIFPAWLDEQRAQHRMRNDDVTCLHLKIISG